MAHRPSPDPPLVIDCDACAHQGTPACEDCVVTFLCDHDPRDAVTIDLAEERALRALATAGLVPELRHQPRSG